MSSSVAVSVAVRDCDAPPKDADALNVTVSSVMLSVAVWPMVTLLFAAIVSSETALEELCPAVADAVLVTVSSVTALDATCPNAALLLDDTSDKVAESVAVRLCAPVLTVPEASNATVSSVIA